MNMLSRFIISLTASFLILPAMFVGLLMLRHPNAETWGPIGEYAVAFILQFFLLGFGLTSFGVGSVAAILWQIFVDRKGR